MKKAKEINTAMKRKNRSDEQKALICGYRYYVGNLAVSGIMSI